MVLVPTPTKLKHINVPLLEWFALMISTCNGFRNPIGLELLYSQAVEVFGCLQARNKGYVDSLIPKHLRNLLKLIFPGIVHPDQPKPRRDQKVREGFVSQVMGRDIAHRKVVSSIARDRQQPYYRSHEHSKNTDQACHDFEWRNLREPFYSVPISVRLDSCLKLMNFLQRLVNPLHSGPYKSQLRCTRRISALGFQNSELASR